MKTFRPLEPHPNPLKIRNPRTKVSQDFREKFPGKMVQLTRLFVSSFPALSLQVRNEISGGERMQVQTPLPDAARTRHNLALTFFDMSVQIIHIWVVV